MRYPRALESRYTRMLLERNRWLQTYTEEALAPVLKRYGPMIDARAAREDSARMDVDLVRIFLEVVTVIEATMRREQPPEQLDLFGLAEDVDDHEATQLRSVLGIPAARTPAQVAVQREWVRVNVDLIKTIDARYFTEIRGVVRETVGRGQSTKALTEDIQHRYRVSRSRARLIARDQVGKLNGQIAGARQQALGITEYKWRTAQDDRVRPEHEDREGVTFKWSEPPFDGPPGQAIQCRCVAEPVLPDD